MPQQETFLQKYIAQDVCVHRNVFILPAVPAFMFVNFMNPVLFASAWITVLFLWIVLWLLVPCNPNLNCTAPGSNQGKDGTKALLVSFLIVYGLLFVVAVAARFFVCQDPNKENYEMGGVLTNLFSFGKTKVPLPPRKGSVSSTLSKYEWKDTNKNIESLLKPGQVDALDAVKKDLRNISFK